VTCLLVDLYCWPAIQLHYCSVGCVRLQEDQQWAEVAGDLPTGLRGRLVLSLLRSSCRGLLEQLGRGAAVECTRVCAACLSRNGTTAGSLGR
jgi:hypothetical protein